MRMGETPGKSWANFSAQVCSSGTAANSVSLNTRPPIFPVLFAYPQRQPWEVSNEQSDTVQKEQKTPHEGNAHEEPKPGRRQDS
jgi:hypothetical protein